MYVLKRDCRSEGKKSGLSIKYVRFEEGLQKQGERGDFYRLIVAEKIRYFAERKF